MSLSSEEDIRLMDEAKDAILMSLNTVPGVKVTHVMVALMSIATIATVQSFGGDLDKAEEKLLGAVRAAFADLRNGDGDEGIAEGLRALREVVN